MSASPAPVPVPALVLVTRPEPEATAWAAQLQALGVPAQALPLIAIGPAADLSPLHAAWQALPSYHALMFVSRNAVDQFFASKPLGASVKHTWSAINIEASSEPALTAPRCWATGPGTAQALQNHGVAACWIDAPPPDAAQFDSEALWSIVVGQARPGQRVLLVRGIHPEPPGAAHAAPDAAPVAMGRDWLEQQLSAVGVHTHSVLAYQRARPVPTAGQMQRLHQAAHDGSVWLFGSSLAIAHLQQLAPGQSWQHARAVATHPRIAQAARAAGFGVVCESRPTLAALVQSIKSLHV